MYIFNLISKATMSNSNSATSLSKMSRIIKKKINLRLDKIKLLDMNDYCLEHLLKFCDADSLVAASSTCNTLNGIASRLFKYKTSYYCQIKSTEDETKVKCAITNLGKHLNELYFRATRKYWNYWLDGAFFFDRLSQKCQNLQILKIVSGISPNIILGIVHTMHQLRRLSIRCLRNREHVNEFSAVALARELEHLRSFQVKGLDWNKTIIIKFLREAENLQSFRCEIIGFSFKMGRVSLGRFQASDSRWTMDEIIHDQIVDQVSESLFYFGGHMTSDFMTATA